MTEWNISRAASELLQREANRREGGRITGEWPRLDLRTAYQVQDTLLRRKTDAGQTLVGVKLGLTSRAKQERMGIAAPLTAWLTDAMALSAGEPVKLDELIHPRVEPEIAFVMRERLAGPGVTAATALAKVGGAHAGFEVIDSRFRDFSFALPDVVADNASAARFVLASTALSPRGLDLAAEACLLEVDGEIVATATGAAVQGHPAEALALAANALAERDLAIEAGWIVLTGGLTDAVPVERGHTVTARFTNLGALSITGV